MRGAVTNGEMLNAGRAEELEQRRLEEDPTSWSCFPLSHYKLCSILQLFNCVMYNPFSSQKNVSRTVSVYTNNGHNMFDQSTNMMYGPIIC